MDLFKEIGELEAGQYISFATRKRSGDFVATPVWFAPIGNYQHYVYSAGDAGKVKRLRNFSQSRIASCTVRGKLTGPWLESDAEILETEEEKYQAYRALRRKYGVLMLVADALSAISGKRSKRVFIRITVDADQ